MTTRKEKHRNGDQAAAEARARFGFEMRGGWIFAPGAEKPIAQGWSGFKDWAIKTGLIFCDIYPHPEDHIWTWRIADEIPAYD